MLRLENVVGYDTIDSGTRKPLGSQVMSLYQVLVLGWEQAFSLARQYWQLTSTRHGKFDAWEPLPCCVGHYLRGDGFKTSGLRGSRYNS